MSRPMTGTPQPAVDNQPPPTGRRRRDLVKTRAALLDAAADVFSRRGLDGATLEEIAESAGFTRGAVYHHFSSKEELFLAVIARRDEELLAGYGPDILGSLPPDPATSTARWRELHANDGREVALRLELRSQALRNETLRTQLVEVDKAAVSATADKLRDIGKRTGVRWRYPVQQIAELFHMVSQAALERAALTGQDTSPLMEMLHESIWQGSVTEAENGS
jgi:AcrR family transcriptional regulator